jgi:hypothetical protein
VTYAVHRVLWTGPVVVAVNLMASMRSSRISVSLSAGVAIVAAIFAAALIWLLLSDPVTVADAVNQGGAAALMFELGQVIYRALLNLLDYL